MVILLSDYTGLMHDFEVELAKDGLTEEVYTAPKGLFDMRNPGQRCKTFMARSRIWFSGKIASFLQVGNVSDSLWGNSIKSKDHGCKPRFQAVF